MHFYLSSALNSWKNNSIENKISQVVHHLFYLSTLTFFFEILIFAFVLFSYSSYTYLVHLYNLSSKKCGHIPSEASLFYKEKKNETSSLRQDYLIDIKYESLFFQLFLSVFSAFFFHLLKYKQIKWLPTAPSAKCNFFIYILRDTTSSKSHNFSLGSRCNDVSALKILISPSSWGLHRCSKNQTLSSSEGGTIVRYSSQNRIVSEVI